MGKKKKNKNSSKPNSSSNNKNQCIKNANQSKQQTNIKAQPDKEKIQTKTQNKSNSSSSTNIIKKGEQSVTHNSIHEEENKDIPASPVTDKNSTKEISTEQNLANKNLTDKNPTEHINIEETQNIDVKKQNNTTDAKKEVTATDIKKQDATVAVKNQDDTAGTTPPPITREHNLELRNMSRKEKKAAKKELYHEYTKDMSTWQRIEYFFSCYKWHILIPIICIVLIAYVGKTIYKNSRPVALAYAILNAEDSDNINTDFQDSYVEYSGITGEYRFSTSFSLEIDYDYFVEHEAYVTTSNSTDYNILSTQCELGDFDVIITNATGLKYCSTAGISHQLKGYFDAEVYNAITPYMYDSEDANGNLVPFALDISDTEFAQSLNIGYEDIYLAFPGANDENKQNAIRLIEYIYNMNLSE